MPTGKPARIGNLLGRSAASRLLDQARALGELDALLTRLIPPPLNDHCRVLSVHGTTLVLAADSPVWAARLRFHTPQLLRQLGGTPSLRTRRIQVRVRAPQSAPETGARLPAARRLSGANADTLRQVADGLSDAGLRAALLRLASRGRHPVQE